MQLIDQKFSNSQKNFIQNLLLKLDNLKCQIKRYISLIKVFRKTISIIIEKQLSIATRKKKLDVKKLRNLFNIIDTI